MMDEEGRSIGVLAARRLVHLRHIDIQPGLSGAEFERVEQHFGFEFADDHRAFLAAGLPVWTTGDGEPNHASWGWPNWRDIDSETLHQQVARPVDCIQEYVDAGGWPTGWGNRPKSEELMKAKAQRLLAKVPRLVPVYAHRYLPAGSGTSGHPVLSVHSLHDIMVYGVNLEDYVVREFHQGVVSVVFWRDFL